MCMIDYGNCCIRILIVITLVQFFNINFCEKAQKKLLSDVIFSSKLLNLDNFHPPMVFLKNGNILTQNNLSTHLKGLCFRREIWATVFTWYIFNVYLGQFGARTLKPLMYWSNPGSLCEALFLTGISPQVILDSVLHHKVVSISAAK